jgi:hypothetical protein
VDVELNSQTPPPAAASTNATSANLPNSPRPRSTTTG